jgi:hypothetical protein
MMAMVITGLIAGTISIMVNSVAVGTNSQQDGRRHLVRLQSLQSRLTATIHSANAILASGSNYLVYWSTDNSDRIVELAELAMIQLDTTSGELRLYQTAFPANYTQTQINSANTSYAANQDWNAAATTAKSGSFFPYTVLAKNVQSFSVTLDNATATSAKLVTCNLTLSDGQITRSGTVVAVVRNPMTPQ